MNIDTNMGIDMIVNTGNDTRMEETIDHCALVVICMMCFKGLDCKDIPAHLLTEDEPEMNENPCVVAYSICTQCTNNNPITASVTTDSGSMLRCEFWTMKMSSEMRRCLHGDLIANHLGYGDVMWHRHTLMHREMVERLMRNYTPMGFCTVLCDNRVATAFRSANQPNVFF